MTSDNDYRPFDPLARANLAASVGEALLETKPVPLGDVGQVVGAGVYVIYYEGDYPAYSPISASNSRQAWQAPIYVGKAIPKGGRKGGLTTSAPGNDLKKRLKEHADSIQAASNLSIEHFWCRFLAVEDIWIPLGENLMISRYAPIWNTTVDGFGNHTPGAGRFKQKRSRWDVLHPGRAWAEKCQPRPESVESIVNEVEEHLRSRPPKAVDGRLFKRE
ncbi:Eco29kI family restriction endonuclease [Phaeobacter sp. S60]|uniref:Eco29kI family restriction endonuclease n=1 Tax=Phaeobacter sp. S60 TaxID=1569353 RepID=UPI0009E2A422|nr:Eco29kI family restriction endonuclease [Phaeobacter sp. S60]